MAPTTSRLHFLFLLLALTCINCEHRQPQPSKPFIIVQPRDIFSDDGVLEFTCRAEGYPKPNIDWYNATDQTPLIDQVPSSGSTFGIHINRHYGQLMISNPQATTTYSVYCNASNSVGWVISSPPVHGGLAFLHSTFQLTPIGKTVHAGDRVQLDCNPPNGFPSPTISWLKNSVPLNLTSSTGKVKLVNRNSLQFTSVSLRDSGAYTCRAENAAGQIDSSPAQLNVLLRAQFIDTPSDLKVRRGQTAEFRCRVADPRQLVEWRKQDGLIDSSRSELTDGRLLLHNVQPSDAGLYICSAPGGILADASLVVETSPDFTQTPDDLTVRQGELVLFQCSATGFPKPSIYWELPDKTPVFPSEPHQLGAVSGSAGNDRIFMHPDGQLQISRVELSDAGKYQCAAHSSVDRKHSTAILTVLPSNGRHKSLAGEKEVQQPIYTLPPIIGLPPANQTHQLDEIVTLDCELSLTRVNNDGLSSSSNVGRTASISSSDLITTWYRLIGRDKVKLVDSQDNTDPIRYSMLPGGSLQIEISALSDSGAYVCEIESKSNPNLKANWTSWVNIVASINNQQPDFNDDPLSPPRSLRLTNVTSSSVSLVWDLSGWPFDGYHHASNSPANRVAYWVEYFRPDRSSDGWVIVERSWPASLVQIHGLDPSTVYYFLIRPRWQGGRIGWSSAPLGPIRTLDQPQILSLDRNQLDRHIKSVEIDDLNLQVLSSWRLRVNWKYRGRLHQPSFIEGFRISYHKLPLVQCLLGQQQRLNTDSYCSLSQSVSMDQLEPTHNELESDETDHSLDVLLHQVSMSEVDGGTALSTLLRDLDPFSCYQINVQPFSTDPRRNTRVEGRVSRDRSIVTYEAIPNSSPTNIQARWLSDTEVEFSWKPPPKGDWNGLLLGYRVYVFNEHQQSHQTYNLTINDPTRLVLRQLEPTVSYSIKLAAVNCKGVGVRSPALQLPTSQAHLRRPGLGVGHGYDPATGRPVKQDDTPISTTLFNQPWFIATLLASLLAWAIVVGLLIYCCCCTASSRRSGRVKKPRHQQLITTSNPPGGSHKSSNSTSLITSPKTPSSNQQQPTSVYLQPLLVQPNGSVDPNSTFLFSNPHHNHPQAVTYSEYGPSYPTLAATGGGSIAAAQPHHIDPNSLLYYDTSHDVGDTYASTENPSTSTATTASISTLPMRGSNLDASSSAILHQQRVAYSSPDPNQHHQLATMYHPVTGPAYAHLPVSNNVGGLPMVAPVAPLDVNQLGSIPPGYYPESSDTDPSSASVTPYAIASIGPPRPAGPPPDVVGRRMSRYNNDPPPQFFNNHRTSNSDEAATNSSRSSKSGSDGPTGRRLRLQPSRMTNGGAPPSTMVQANIPPPPDYPPPSPLDTVDFQSRHTPPVNANVTNSDQSMSNLNSSSHSSSSSSPSTNNDDSINLNQPGVSRTNGVLFPNRGAAAADPQSTGHAYAQVY